MPTKYDVFAELIEKAPCTASKLPFKTPIYSHLKSLIKENLIKKDSTKYIPVKNNKSQAIFSIIKYCLKNGLDYNLILSKNTPKIIQELFSKAPNLRPKLLTGNKENAEILNYLEKNQFILLTKNKPKKGIILKHQLFESIKILYNIKQEFNTTKYINTFNEVKELKSEEINPFDDKVFEFLSGSAQLEGSTVTIGETKELILNDIYPEKPKKDIQMVKNLNEAMHYILEHINEDITEEHIKEINKIVLFSMHRNAGKYKTTHNKIQGNPDFKTSHPSKVSIEMKSYCEKLKTINTKEKCLKEIGFIHNEIQHIHPFSDGNSRTTRMILNWILLKNKAPIIVIKMGCFDEYMSLTKLSKTRDDKKLTQLFHHTLLHEELIN
ncbi:Fic family protein [Candidatus Woesearchaeota archaeon]|nr:Fic family protein [Candidatus Woesearchaeota archaeon]